MKPLMDTANMPQTLERVLLSPPDVGTLEQSFVSSAMASGWIAPAGPDLEAFEAELAARAGVEHVVGLSSGTAALHLGLLALGVKPGDTVVTSALTFAATANAISYCGAHPAFVDCGADGNLDPDHLVVAIDTLRAQGKRISAVVPVDIFGRIADYSRILPICEDRGVPVLADAAESFGAHSHGRAAGSLGAASAVSFNGNKIMTTSGGGALFTDDGNLADYVRHLATQARQPVAHYEHTEIGFNYRLSNVLAALGRAQLTRLESMIEQRRAVRRVYRDLVAGVEGARLLTAATGDDDNAWLTVMLVDPNVIGFTARELAKHLALRGVETRPVWKPMHLQPVYAHCPMIGGDTSERLFERGIALPSGSAMTGTQLTMVLNGLEEMWSGALGTATPLR